MSVHPDTETGLVRQCFALPDAAPRLLTVVHTEEEFDWNAPFDPTNTKVAHLRDIARAQDIFMHEGAKPAYMVDYSVAADDTGAALLRNAIAGSEAEIGAHLHPWVTPPIEEAISEQNSFPGNLPRALEMEKLTRLTDRIDAAFGHRPTSYLAGRYGFGPHTLSILQALRYRVDLSGVAMTSFSGEGGPDFSTWDNRSFWDGDPAILRIPHNVAAIGFLCRDGRALVTLDQATLLKRLHVPGILARLGAVQRVRLSPEGFTLAHLRASARTLIAAGVRVLVFSFHSPSIVPGCTPYVRDRTDLADFLTRISGFLRFFRDDLGGTFATPDNLLDLAASNRV